MLVDVIKIVVREIPFLTQHGGSVKLMSASQFDDDD
jgi:Fe-S cluster biogenesis protein NfuA